MKICNFWLKIEKQIVQTLKIPVIVIVIFVQFSAIESIKKLREENKLCCNGYSNENKISNPNINTNFDTRKWRKQHDNVLQINSNQ